VDHSYAEVFIHNRWISVDSYILDQKLFARAQAALKHENASIGYGTVQGATCRWDGATDAYSQFVQPPPLPSFSNQDWGVYSDVTEFYGRAKGTFNGNLITRIIFQLASGVFNRRIKNFRELQ
jgi:hypothetical protein